MAPADDYQGIQSVARALSILEQFSDKVPSATVNELAELTGLSRSTCYRFCRTLKQLGYLDEVGDGRYRPGLRAAALAYSALSSRELPELAMPYLRRLRDETNETVNMAVLSDTEVIYVARLPSDHLISLRLYVGSRLPAYASSLGRAILAFLPEDAARSVIDRSQMTAITPNTISDRDQLWAELRIVRRQGYAVNDQGVAIGLRGVAAPVLTHDGNPIAAINVSIPHPLTSPLVSEEVLAPKVIATAREIGALASMVAPEHL